MNFPKHPGRLTSFLGDKRALIGCMPLLACLSCLALACDPASNNSKDGGLSGGLSWGLGDSIDLGKECTNAGALTTVGSLAYVACAGNFSGNGELAIVDLDDPSYKVTHVPTGGAPGSVVVDGDRVYLGDMLDGQVLVAGTDGSVLHGASDAVLICPSDAANNVFQFVPDIAVVGATVYATCFATDEVVAFTVSNGSNPGDGTKNANVLGRAVGGDGLSAMAHWGARDLVGLDNLGGTATHIPTDPLEAARAYWTVGDVPNDLIIEGDLAAITNSGSNTLQLLDLAASKTTAEVPTGDNSNPWSVAAMPGFYAVSLQGTNEVLVIDRDDNSEAARIAMPAGDALMPFGAALPLAHPQGISTVDEERFVTGFTNLDKDFAPAANSRLQIVIKLHAA